MDLKLLIEAFVIIIIIGVVYSLWQTTRLYGGLIGVALKWISLGMIFFSLEALDRVLGPLSFIKSFALESADTVHNIILMMGLVLCGIGLSRLMRIAK